MFLEVKRECSSQALCTAVMKPSWTGLVLFEFEMAFISTIFLSQLCILLIAFFPTSQTTLSQGGNRF